jgi:ribosomal protein L40E
MPHYRHDKAVRFMVKFEEATARKLRNVFVCRTCKSKIRAPSLKVAQKKIKCRKCDSKKLRPKRKK